VTLINPQSPLRNGCTSDGLNDCTAGFQAAVDAGDLHIPAGTYLVNGSVSVPSGTLSQYKNIVCDPNAVIKYLTWSSAHTAVFDWNGTSYGNVVGCTFSGASTQKPAIFIGGQEWNFASFTQNGASHVNFVANTYLNSQGNSAVQAYGPTNVSTFIRLLYNSYQNCSLYGPALTTATDSLIEFNNFVDCGPDFESDISGKINARNIEAYNRMTGLNRHLSTNQAGTSGLPQELVFSSGAASNGRDYITNQAWYNSINDTLLFCEPGQTWQGNLLSGGSFFVSPYGPCQ
jgi:hypothetical protein